MSDQIQLERKHILFINWHILGELWKKEYREEWKKSNIDSKGKSPTFKLSTKVSLKDISSDPLHFYDFFYIGKTVYDEIVHGKITNKYEKKVKIFTEKTNLKESIFKGELCIIQIVNDDVKSLIYNYADAQLKSIGTLGYSKDIRQIIKLIEEQEAYNPIICDAKLFVKTRGASIPKRHAIERNINFIESTAYKEILKNDITLLNKYKKILESHLEKVNSCIVYINNI